MGNGKKCGVITNMLTVYHILGWIFIIPFALLVAGIILILLYSLIASGIKGDIENNSYKERIIMITILFAIIGVYLIFSH